MRSGLKERTNHQTNLHIEVVLWQIKPKEEILSIQWTPDYLADTKRLTYIYFGCHVRWSMSELKMSAVQSVHLFSFFS